MLDKFGFYNFVSNEYFYPTINDAVQCALMKEEIRRCRYEYLRTIFEKLRNIKN